MLVNRAYSTAPPRDELEYDVAIVGGGPSGLSAAIKFKQLCRQYNKDYSICVLEKGSEIGSHILSGCVMEPRGLDELLPGWMQGPVGNDDVVSMPPTLTKAEDDRFYFLTEKFALRSLTPPQMDNEGAGNYIVSLSQVTRWMAEIAEKMGVDIFPGFAGDQLLVEDNRVKGVILKDMGISKSGAKKDSYQPGAIVKAKLTLLAEGCRGSLTKKAEAMFNLREGKSHQTYALGLKEIWKIKKEHHDPGLIIHTVGWPLSQDSYGGSFMYHMQDDSNAEDPQYRMAVGFVVALDYHNPHMNLFGEFQKWKTHPKFRHFFQDAECLQYGARTLNEGGLQSIPKLTFPGGGIVGCAAGFLNVPKIKGTHTAIKSGMLASEAAFFALEDAEKGNDIVASMSIYDKLFESSWIYEELYKVRNIRPGFKYGLYAGLINAAFETYISRGKAPWTLTHGPPDHTSLKDASQTKAPQYPKSGPANPNVLDILTAVNLSGTFHDHDEEAHLRLKDKSVPSKVNYPKYAGPESRYCPAKVYEYTESASGSTPELVINAQNCLHCKACDIKDPTQNINWTVPEGGDGPKYTMM